MTNRKLHSCALSISIVTATSLIQAVAYAADTAPVIAFDADDTTGQVRELFRDATAQMVTGDLASARKTLLQIWTIRQTADVAGALGQVELATKRFREAAEHFDWCLDHFPPVESDKVLKATRVLFGQAKQHVAQLRISANRDGADIRIDGKAVGTSPLVSPLYLEPGKHEITGWLGTSHESRVIVADKGKQYAINFAFAPGATSATGNRSAGVPVPSMTSQAEQSSDPKDSHDSVRRSIVPVIVGGAVFAVGLGTGIGLKLASNSKYDDAESLRNQVGPTGCVSETQYPSQCADIRSAIKSGDRYQNWSTVGFVAAGAALVATPIYWFWPRQKASSAITAKPVSLVGAIAPAYSGVSLSGEF